MQIQNLMKRILIILVLGALMACPVPIIAQNVQEWQTSTMMGSGSTLAPQVTEVGAHSAISEATTEENSSPARVSQPRRSSDFGPGQDGGNQDPSFPIGDAWSLAVFAVMFAAMIAIKKYSINPKED